MILRGVDFGTVWNASGARNFFGDGWRQTRAVDFFGGWVGSTFVAKTTTWAPRLEPENGLGNMRLDPVTLQPVDWFPDCVWFDWRRGISLNAVGLSGPGAPELLRRGWWQKRQRPFFISFMSMAATPEERLAELRAFVGLLLSEKWGFRARFGLKINISCPNVGLDPKALIPEARGALDLAAVLGIPLVIKITLEADPRDVSEIAAHSECDALCVGNTVKFGRLPDRIDWIGLFGTDDPTHSPLARYGGGGLSGPVLLPILKDWLLEYRRLDSKTPVSACGGIFRARDALWLFDHRAVSAVELGTVATLRPWRVQRIIRAVNRYVQPGRQVSV